MITAKICGCSTTTAYGLTQWDYGQELAIECASTAIHDGTEVNFYQKKLSDLRYIINGHVMIPDIMLQNPDEIVAYVYVRSENSGETILSIRLPVCARPRPENYVLPEYEEYKRLIPMGGEPGQVLAKKTGLDYEVGWEDGAAGDEITEQQIDELCN